MNIKLKLNTKDETLEDILGGGKKYFVPKFQRDYSWEREQLITLWEDIELVLSDKENSHYMGYLVLQEAESNNFKIIDGQQRITTFSLLILAAIKRLKEIGDDDARERADELYKTFIGSKDIISLKISNKITLNKNNDYYYREGVEGKELPKRNKKQTVVLMSNAVDYFYGVFKDKDGEGIGRIISVISQNLFFTTIYIGDELNAYKVFETLNARGVQLSSSDLLKNYIFSLIDKNGDIPDEELTRLEERWNTIGSNIGSDHYTEYILCEWNTTHKLVRKTSLFSNIKAEIKTSEQADKYLEKLLLHSDLYAALLNPYNEFWEEDPRCEDIKSYLSFLNLFGIKQPRSLLFSAYQKYKGDFNRILRWIVVFSFRYNVIGGRHPGEQEVLYNEICRMIDGGCTLEGIKTEIFKLYPKDERFKQSFSDKTMPTHQSKKKARYILARLAEYQSKDHAIEEEELTVEHILPLNPNETWSDEFGEHWQYFNQRIGNMALVSKSENKNLDQNPFDKKKAILMETGYTINNTIEDYDEWSPESVESRQKKLADIAVKVWRID